MNNDTPTYNKLQWSVFVKNGRDQQYVVRADTIDELKKLRNEVLAIVGEDTIENQPTVKPAPTIQPSQIGCATCGAPATRKSGVSKAGKPYNGVFCSTEDKTHTVWLK